MSDERDEKKFFPHEFYVHKDGEMGSLTVEAWRARMKRFEKNSDLKTKSAYLTMRLAPIFLLYESEYSYYFQSLLAHGEWTKDEVQKLHDEYQERDGIGNSPLSMILAGVCRWGTPELLSSLLENPATRYSVRTMYYWSFGRNEMLDLVSKKYPIDLKDRADSEFLDQFWVCIVKYMFPVNRWHAKGSLAPSENHMRASLKKMKEMYRQEVGLLQYLFTHHSQWIKEMIRTHLFENRDFKGEVQNLLDIAIYRDVLPVVKMLVLHGIKRKSRTPLLPPSDNDPIYYHKMYRLFNKS